MDASEKWEIGWRDLKSKLGDSMAIDLRKLGDRVVSEKTYSSLKCQLEERIRGNEDLKKKLEERDGEIERFRSAAKCAQAETMPLASNKLFPGEDVLPQGVDARRVVYLYWALVASERVDGVRKDFLSLFNLFDDGLFGLLRGTPDELNAVRGRAAEDLNARLTNLKVRWDVLGEAFDRERHLTSDLAGDKVTEVISALIVRSDGTVVRRAKVRTSADQT